MSRENAKEAPALQIRTARPSSVRKVNRSIMLELIRRRQPISRAELARLTGVFRSSVSDIVDELLGEDLVTEEKGNSFQRGRAPVSLRLNDSSYRVLGLNIRPAYCQIACAGLSGRIEKSLQIATPTSPNKLVQAVSEAVDQLRADKRLRGPNGFRRMGVAVPGHVDVSDGRILWMPTHSELDGFPIATEIFRETGVAAHADNDCNVGALSELWLSTREEKDRSADFVFLNVSDFGVGAGAVINGQIYPGHDGHFAAEVGHMVVEPAGAVCRCGREGCWEMYVSNHATWKRVHPRTPFTVEGFEQMLSAAKSGQARELAALRETAKYLSLGISNIGFMFNPAEVVVAGRITAVWDLMHREMASRYESQHLRCALRPARLSADDSLLHGAVCLAARDVFASPKFGET